MWGGLRKFFVRFAVNLEHSGKRFGACRRESGETVDQYRAKLIVLADELEFIDSMQILKRGEPVSVTPEKILAQFLDGCGDAVWRFQCGECKTINEAMVIIKKLVAAEYDSTSVIYTGSKNTPMQVNAISEDTSSSTVNSEVKRQTPCLNCGDWYCADNICENQRSVHIPQLCDICNTYGHSTKNHYRVAEQKKLKQLQYERDLNESGASNL